MKRKAQFAGSWYEGNRESLIHQILSCEKSSFGTNSQREALDSKMDIIGIISPHAGYRYSGATASIGFSVLQQRCKEAQEIIVLGPDHRGWGSGVTLYPRGSWETPIDVTKTSQEAVEYWQNYSWELSHVTVRAEPHKPEHSLEMQVPMLQYYHNPQFIAPILITNQNIEVAEQLSSFLIDYITSTKRKIPIVASSDFSHENNYDKLQKNDVLLENAILTGNAYEVNTVRLENSITTCGYGPMTTLLLTADKLAKVFSKSVKVQCLGRTNSALVTGNPPGSYTVGYASFVVGLV